ncbi:hypothetical protein KAH81_06920 [bacterium]|nr:hypothetical protein [bacterium]
MKYVISGLICLIIGFLVGFVPMSMKKAEMTKQLEDCGDNLKSVYDRLEISEPYRIALNEFIGAYEASANKNFGISKTLAVSAFDRVQPLAEAGISPFAEAVSKRDDIIATLARGDDKTEVEMRLFLFSLYKGE